MTDVSQGTVEMFCEQLNNENKLSHSIPGIVKFFAALYQIYLKDHCTLRSGTKRSICSTTTC
jgi:hypothetical protein